MTTLSLAFGAALALGSVGPAFAQNPSQPRDVGNMAYPTPLPQGRLGTTMPGRTPETASAAYPAPLAQGSYGASTPGPSRTPTDTGNMAYPTPVPQGSASATGTAVK